MSTSGTRIGDEVVARVTAPVPVEADEFTAAYGEPLARTLDLATWRPSEEIAVLYARLDREVAEALAQSDTIRDGVRRIVLPQIAGRAGAPRDAGLYQATARHLEAQHRGLLFAGEVEACDGTMVPHETLALSITAIGVVLVSYQGDLGTWGHRLFRRDLRTTSPDPHLDTLDLLNPAQEAGRR